MLADLARRTLLLFGLLIFLIPLLSLMSSGGAPSVAVGSSLAFEQVAEAFVLVFIVGALARSILDGRLFIDSRLVRPALALAAIVAVWGLCAVFEQSADARVALGDLWRSAGSYFASRAAADTLQPTLHWLELAALAPLVELSVRRRPAWRNVTLVVWVITLAAGLAVALSWSRPTQAGVGDAANSRVEMAKIALKMTAQAPVFGVGLGRFAWASRDYMEPGVVASFPEAALGENAHNNFLQILAELGCVGFAAFMWMLWAAMRPMAVDPQARAARIALVAGLATFFLSALFWQPLLIYPIAAATFVTLGLAAGMLPARAGSPARGRLRWAEWILIAVVLVSMPWRISAALSPGTPEVVGAGPLQPALEGMQYRVAEQLSRWRMRAHTRTVVASMRWDPTGAADCRVRIRVRNRPPDEVGLRRDMWIPVRFSIPAGGRPSERPEVGFEVSSPTCRLFVGTVTALR